jgi:hypothetical protein
VSLLHGAAGRDKLVKVEGVSGEELRARLERP